MRLKGLSKKQYKAMSTDQGDACASCNKHKDHQYRDMYIDHDQNTGEVRGLLCAGCSVALGYSGHNVRTLKLLITYLELHSGKE